VFMDSVQTVHIHLCFFFFSMFLAQDTQHDEDFHLKPTSTAGVLDTSKWPLLLKVRYLSNVILLLLVFSDFICLVTTCSL